MESRPEAGAASPSGPAEAPGRWPLSASPGWPGSPGASATHRGGAARWAADRGPAHAACPPCTGAL
eukprot:11670175-Heterocapsa_arctica.AAC.1